MGAKPDPREEILCQVSDALHVLAANIIGIVRGAGKPLELSRDVDAFTAALGAFEGATGGHPKAWELAAMLTLPLPGEFDVRPDRSCHQARGRTEFAFRQR